ncbi:MAG: glycogen/starch synthase [Polyangiaceae bacterium]|nr:glycogen/starch synthase [Polyangiaceae bacterium]
MDVVMVASEVAPYLRRSPAALPIGELAKALRQLGHDVNLVVPRHPAFESAGLLLARRITPLPVAGGGEAMPYDAQLASGVVLTLLGGGLLDDRERADRPEDEAERAVCFGRAVAALVRERASSGRDPGVVHAHGWQGARALLALSEVGDRSPRVLSLHDDRLGADAAGREAVVRGSARADVVTFASAGLERSLAGAGADTPLAAALAEAEVPSCVVPEGLDFSLYNPATDPGLVARFDAEDAAGKGRGKAALLRELGLELELDRPLCVAVLEGGASDGAALVLEAAERLLRHDLTLVVCSAGELPASDAFAKAQSRHAHELARVARASDEQLRRAMAAADFALLSPLAAPAARPLLVAQRYGAVPIVHGVGALAEGVVDCDVALETGTGFVFEAPTAQALLGAVARARAACATPAWGRLRRRVMRQDCSWDRPARRMLQLYQSAAGDAA